MKNKKNVSSLKRLLLILVCLYSTNVLSQEIYSKKGFSLEIKNTDPDLNQSVKQSLIDTYFAVYPVLARYYNIHTAKEVTFLIDTSYTGVAEAGGRQVRINPKWLKQHPNDFDLITHEVMHLVQNYPSDAGPWWLTEGIADYVRYVFGVDNALGGWSLPEYSPDQNYDNSYRITARFLLWIENEVKPGTVKQLDHAMRTRTYKPESWREITGLSVDELWAKYAANPEI